MSSSSPNDLAQGLSPGYGTQPQHHATTLARVEPSSHKCLGDLPGELVLQITKNIDLPDKYHLMSTCKGMYALIRQIIYREDLSSPEPRALRWACAHGHINIIHEILDSGMSIDHVFGQDACIKTTSPDDSLHGRGHACTPLMTAIAFRQLAAVQYLLEREANPNFAPTAARVKWSFDKWKSECHWAYEKQPTSLAFYKPLHWAVNPQLAGITQDQKKKEDKLTEEIVRVLIEHRADVQGAVVDHPNVGYPEIHSMQPLTLAVVNQYTPISVLRILQDAGAPAADHTVTPAVNAFYYFVMAHFYARSSQHSRWSSMSSIHIDKLLCMLARASLSDLDIIYEKGFNQIALCVPTPAMLQATYLFLQNVRGWCLRRVAFYSWQPPLTAAIKCFSHAVESIEEDENWDIGDLYSGYEKFFSMLIEEGAPLERPEPVNEALSEWWDGADTALTALCQKTFPEEFPLEYFMDFFLSKGALPTGRDCRGYSALHYASKIVSTRAATILLSRAPLSEMDTHGKDRDVDGAPARPILITVCDAVKHGTKINTRAKFADLLIRHGANVNVLDQAQHSPLACACRKRDAELVRVLLEHGADPNLDPAPFTPLVVAINMCSDRNPFVRYSTNPDDDPTIQIVEMLLERGANWTPEDWWSNPELRRVREANTCPERIAARLGVAINQGDTDLD